MAIEEQEPIGVANFIIKRAIENKWAVTNLQLQKVLFFLQGAFLYKFNTPLMDGSFSKWDYGPVEQDVYHRYRNNGPMMIESLAPSGTIFDIKPPKMMQEESFSEAENDFFEETLEKLLKINPWELVKWTHSLPSWRNYERAIKLHDKVDEYSNEEISEAYKQFEGKINDGTI